MLLNLKKEINKYLDKFLGIRITQGFSVRPSGIEDEAWDVMSASKGRTMGTFLQQYSMWLSTKYVAQNRIDGDIVEFGVWRGGMSLIAANTLQQFNDSGRNLFLFDTFSGMTEPTDLDIEITSKKSAKFLLNKEKKVNRKNGTYNTWCIADLDDVKNGFITHSKFPAEKIKYIKGDVLTTVPTHLPEKISICRIDTDWYESTSHLLHNCWERIVPGGILILDDYDYWDGARKAANEFFDEFSLSPMLFRPDSGRVIIKC